MKFIAGERLRKYDLVSLDPQTGKAVRAYPKMKTGEVYRTREGHHYVVIGDYGKYRPLMLDSHWTNLECNTHESLCPTSSERPFYEGDRLAFETLDEYFAHKLRASGAI